MEANSRTMGLRTSDRRPVLALALTFCVVCACVVVTSGHIRGTDQYWYVADVESLSHGQHVTNNIYPANMATPGPLPRPFVHNNLTLYIAVPFTRLLGGQAGWLATNLACTLGSALLVWLSLRKTSAKAAALAASLFLLLPITIWLTCNALSEPIYLFLTTLCLFVWLRAKDPLSQAFFVITAVAAALAKDNLVVLLLVPIFGLGLWRGEWRSNFRGSLYLVSISLLGLGVFAILRKTIFAENINYSLAARLITSLPPKNDNMAPYFLSSPPVFSWGLLWEKAARNIPSLLKFPAAEAPFVLPCFVLLGLFLWCLLSKRRTLSIDCKATRACTVTILLIASYCATILLFQNEFRYMFFLVPALLVSVSLCLNWTERRIRVLAVCILCLLPVAPVLAVRIRKEGMQQYVETKKIQQFVNSNAVDGTPLLVVRNGSRFMEVTFAVRPRPALIAEEPEFCGQLNRYRKRFPVRYAFGPASFLASKSKHIADIEDDAGSYAGYGVFNIQTSCQ